MTFKDNSYCEEAFTIFRIDSDGINSVVAPNFSYYMTNVCNVMITPGIEYSDDLKKTTLVVGKTYEYCVSAVASEYMAQLPDARGNRPFLKSSAVICENHIVRWVSN